MIIKQFSPKGSTFRMKLEFLDFAEGIAGEGWVKWLVRLRGVLHFLLRYVKSYATLQVFPPSRDRSEY